MNDSHVLPDIEDGTSPEDQLQSLLARLETVQAEHPSMLYCLTKNFMSVF